jgi:hypothetical protein
MVCEQKAKNNLFFLITLEKTSFEGAPVRQASVNGGI